MVHAYLASQPSIETYDFLLEDFSALTARHGGVVATSFRRFPSFPQRYIERLAEQMACEADAPDVAVEPLRPPSPRSLFTEDDLHVRRFTADSTRRLIRRGKFKAA